jgi:hypothetical protein
MGRAARERRIAKEAAIALYEALGPAMEDTDGERLMSENLDLVADVFGRVCQRHH